MKRGKFIIIDGGEGAGKGTVLNKLKEVFQNDSQVIFTREPGGTEFAERIRELILSPEAEEASAATLFALFWASRSDHSHRKIGPSIKEGKHVICDRYDSSTWAYQLCAQGNESLVESFWAMREVCSPVKPDLYIYLDVDPYEGLRRAKERGDLNHFDGRNIAFHSKVRAGFLKFFAVMLDKGVRIRVIDANRSQEDVVSEAIAVVSTILA